MIKSWRERIRIWFKKNLPILPKSIERYRSGVIFCLTVTVPLSSPQNSAEKRNIKPQKIMLHAEEANCRRKPYFDQADERKLEIWSKTRPRPTAKVDQIQPLKKYIWLYTIRHLTGCWMNAITLAKTPLQLGTTTLKQALSEEVKRMNR